VIPATCHDADPPAIKQLIDVFHRRRAVLAVERSILTRSSYGIVDVVEAISLGGRI
jgi:hypothetical protein